MYQSLLTAIAFALLAILASTPVTAKEPPHDDGLALIKQYGLREATVAEKNRANWRKPRKIAVDDGVPGLSAAVRAAAAELTVAAGKSIDEFAAAAADADILIGRSAIICQPRVLETARELRWIQSVYAGVEACTSQPSLAARGVLLTNMRAIGSPAIAEHALAMMLGLARNLDNWRAFQQKQQWSQQSGRPMSVLAGKTVLVVGLGGIGGEVAQRAHLLGMRVIASRATQQARPDYVEIVGTPADLPRLLGEADYVVNALPLTAETRGLFNRALFAKFKRGAYFINVGRGATVVTDDLMAGLRDGGVGGAGLDVTDPEPLPPKHPLWQLPNVILTPHVAGDSDLGVEPQLRLLRENLRRYLIGDKMLSVVDLTRGY